MTAADFGVEEDGTGATGDSVKDVDGKREKKKGNNLFADATVPSFFRRGPPLRPMAISLLPLQVSIAPSLSPNFEGEEHWRGVEGTPNKSGSSPEVEGSKGKFCAVSAVAASASSVAAAAAVAATAVAVAVAVAIAIAVAIAVAVAARGRYKQHLILCVLIY